MGPVQQAVRANATPSQVLETAARGAAFVIDQIDDEGLRLLLGRGRWPTRLSWDCLEGIVRYLTGAGWVRIASKHETGGELGTLDAYLKGCTNTATAEYVAALLERAGGRRRRPLPPSPGPAAPIGA